MKSRLLLVALAATPLVCAAADPGIANNATAPSAAPRISQEKLERIRNALVKQIAVYEPAEHAMRAPTTAEAAALSAPAAATTPNIVGLPRGGVALQGDMSNASFAVVRRGEDGKLVIGHDVAIVNKGDAHGR